MSASAQLNGVPAEKPGPEIDHSPKSLSADPKKKMHKPKPKIKPPFADVSMGRFLTYLVLGLVLLAGWYTYRFTVWAANVGGYYNLLTGHRDPVAAQASTAASAADAAVSAVNSAAATQDKEGKDGKSGAEEDVQSLIFHLADKLGVKPAEIQGAIRPLVDPTAPDPTQAVQAEAEALKDSAVQQEKKAEAAEPGFIETVGEVFLD